MQDNDVASFNLQATLSPATAEMYSYRTLASAVQRYGTDILGTVRVLGGESHSALTPNGLMHLGRAEVGKRSMEHPEVLLSINDPIFETLPLPTASSKDELEPGDDAEFKDRGRSTHRRACITVSVFRT